MRRFIVLIALILSLIISSTVFAKAVKDDSVSTDDGYYVYKLVDFGFVIPDYLSEVESSTREENRIDFLGTMDSKLVSLSLFCIQTKDEGGFFYYKVMYTNMLDALFDGMSSSIGEIEEKGSVEKLTSHGCDCYLSTTSFKNGCFMKAMIILDETNENIYIISYLYQKELDNTKCVSDFYKMIYTDPYENVKTNEESSTASDYLEMLGTYAEGLESLNNGNYSDAIGKFADVIEKSGSISNNNYSQQDSQTSDADVMKAYFDFLGKAMEYSSNN